MRSRHSRVRILLPMGPGADGRVGDVFCLTIRIKWTDQVGREAHDIARCSEVRYGAGPAQDARDADCRGSAAGYAGGGGAGGAAAGALAVELGPLPDGARQGEQVSDSRGGERPGRRVRNLVERQELAAASAAVHDVSFCAVPG